MTHDPTDDPLFTLLDEIHAEPQLQREQTVQRAVQALEQQNRPAHRALDALHREGQVRVGLGPADQAVPPLPEASPETEGHADAVLLDAEPYEEENEKTQESTPAGTISVVSGVGRDFNLSPEAAANIDRSAKGGGA